MGNPPVDVAIVGAGAAGTLLAAKLAEGGKSVAVFDAGPPWGMADLVSSQLWSRRLRWGGPFVPTGGANPIGFGFNTGWGFGGAALHHYGTWPRLHVEDFKVKSLFGRGLDWPISYDDLRPHYDAVQAEVGVSGDAASEIWRPPGAPYPMPPLEQTAQAKVLDRGFQSLGLRTAPSPMAINSVEYGGRPACLYDGWCDAGCPIGALANPLAVYHGIAVERGARFTARAPVTRVLTGSRDRVEAIEYLHRGRELRRQAARLVILAASVGHNPAILLNSTSGVSPNGLGNTNGLVGRYVMTHAGVVVFGLFDDDTEPHRGVTGAQLICHEGYKKDSHAAPAFGSFQWLIAPSVKPNDLAGIAASRPDLIGSDLTGFMTDAVRHVANMVGMAEQLPDPDNRVELSSTQTPWKTRGPQFRNRFGAETTALWAKMRDQGVAVFKAAGGRDVWHSPQISAHLMGGTIMGDDPANSVTDSFGRLHGMRNLFVAGPGLFPTGGGVNPTFTVHALARRTAEHILAQWSTLIAGS